MSGARRPTGFVRVLKRANGPVFYAQIRTVDGGRLQRRLGPVWSKRSRPPEGYLTPAQAELRLAEMLAGRLVPEFGANTPLSAITTAEVEAFRERMVAEGLPSARTINKRLQQLHSIFKRAGRVWDLPGNPVANAERQPQQRSGDFTALEPHEARCSPSTPSRTRTRRCSRSRRSAGCGSGSCAGCAGAMSTGCGG